MKELAKKEDVALMARELPSDLRALAALVINMLHRHSHEQRQAVLRFALEKEKFIPVSKTSVFSGTSLDPQRQIE
jgi:hypothetical protein